MIFWLSSVLFPVHGGLYFSQFSFHQRSNLFQAGTTRAIELVDLWTCNKNIIFLTWNHVGKTEKVNK